MKSVKMIVGEIEVTLDDRELNLLRSALTSLKTNSDLDIETNTVVNELDFKIFRMQQRTTMPLIVGMGKTKEDV